MKTELTIRVILGPEALTALRRPVNGEGGFQNLLRALQHQLAKNELTLTPELIERIARYVERYGHGGFQGRLDAVLVELKQLAQVLRPMAA